jgi:hypothetical protein
MSKNNNVNPGLYKLSGRERLGEHLNQQAEKQRLVKSREEIGPKGKTAKKKCQAE